MEEPCPGDPLSTDEATALAARSTDGMDAYIGRALTGPGDCGWTYGGYALPLLEDPANAFWWSWLGQPAPWAGGSLGYHVSTTSTSTVYLRNVTSSRTYGCTYRMYFQSPKLVTNGSGAQFTGSAALPHNVNDAYPDDPSRSLQYPARYLWREYEEDASRSRECFNGDYLAFVDSPDGGVTFPVWGPRAYMPTWDAGTGEYVFQWDWDAAGWRQTALRTRYADAADEDGLFVRYQDATVLDLFDEIGYFVLVAVECRSDVGAGTSLERETETEGQCGCVNSCSSECPTGFANPDTGADPGIPFTRVVLFFSRSPDFAGGEVYPHANSSPHALVFLRPDRGSDGPGSGACPNEWYGVPHAVVTPDRAHVLLYVPWTGYGEAEDFPSRVRARYPEGTYAAANEDGVVVEAPRWQPFPGGVSCFRVSVASLAGIADSLARRAETAGVEGVYPTYEGMLLWVQRLMSYQGEVLITEGEVSAESSPDGAGDWYHPVAVPGVTDPQFVYVGDELWVYWDSESAPMAGEAGGDTVQLRQARLTTVAELEATSGSSLSDALGRNGAATLFLKPSDPACGVEFDARSLFQAEGAAYDDAGWGVPGLLVADPDVVVISDGRLRVSFFGDASRGLQVAFTDVAAACR